MEPETTAETRGELAASGFDRVLFYGFLAMLVAVPLAIWTYTEPAASPLKWYIIRIVAPLLAVGWFIHRALAGRLTVHWSAITIAALALLGTQCISLVHAVNPWLTLDEISKSLGLLAAYFLAVNTVASVRDRDTLLWCVAATGCVAALYGIAQRFGWDFFPWQVAPATPVRRGVSFFGHANFAAHFIVVALPLAAGLMITRSSLLLRAVAGLFGLLMLYHLTITGTRGAALGLGAAVVTVVAVFLHTWYRSGGRSAARIRKIAFDRKTLLAAGSIGLAVAIAGTMMVAVWRVKESDPLAIREGHGIFRLRTWYTATRVFLQHPIVGIGAGNYEVISPAYWHEGEAKQFVEENRMSYRVHNEYIETAAEQGIIGLGALLALMMIALYEAGELISSDRDRKERFVGLGLFAAVAGLCVDCLVNFDLQTPASALLFWVVLGLITRATSERRLRSRLELAGSSPAN